MKFESVRLLHAQGVPDHYIANQVYQPIDEDHKQRGSLIILLDHAGTTDGAFVASLINTLIREYYRHADQDRLHAFEQSLVRLNEQIKQFARAKESSFFLSLSGTIVLSTENEIHITHIGTPLAYLWRDKALIGLVDNQSDTAEITPSFSVITSGEITPDDVLVLMTDLHHQEEINHDLTFALSHVPLFESGRAFARLIKQKFERTTEVILVHFNEESDTTYQVYVDRSLETAEERFGHVQKALGQHGSYLLSGVEWIVNQFSRLGRKKKFAMPTIPGIKATTDNLAFESEADLSETLTETTLPAPESPPEDPLPLPENEGDFRVTSYRQTHQKPDQREVALEEAVMPDEEPNHEVRGFTLPSFKSRTIYLLVGILVLLFVIIRIFNVVSNRTPKIDQTTEERNALITQADAASRDADVAQVNDDTAGAISHLMTGLNLLKGIQDSNQNEQSKALANRMQQTFTQLTKTTPLAKATDTQPLTSPPQKTITTSKGVFALATTGMDKYAANTVTPVIPYPTDFKLKDAVALDNFQKIVLVGTAASGETVVQIYNPEDNTFKVVTRADSKPWPASRLIASFETNFYLVGDTMSKATPKDNAYRFLAYGKETTSGVTAIANNGIGFYAIENSNALVRIAANSPKTAVKYFGVPDTFWPKKINRIISRKEGTLYLFDAEGQRILVLSTDGGYKSQFTLPTDAEYSDCDATENSFVCTTGSNQIKTFAVPG